MTGGAARRVDIIGCRIDGLTLAEAVDKVDELVGAGEPTLGFLANADTILKFRDDARLREIVSRCALVMPDGQSVVWAARLLGERLPERVGGPDLFDALLALAARRGHSVYLLGAKPGVAAQAARRAEVMHPGLRVAGVDHGYFDVGDVTVAERVRQARPDMLFVGMPSPRKEYWVSENLERLAVPFTLGVGGTFDVVAGLVSRAPTWMQRAGLEWVYRLGQEPRRMWKRYLVGNTRFVALVARESWRRHRGRQASP